MNKNERSSAQREEIVNIILDQCASGELDWNKPWNPQALSPYNPVSNVTYRGMNRAYLAHVATSREFNDPRWVTFNQAKSQDWHIRKGEKAAGYVEKWQMLKPKTIEELQNDDGEIDKRDMWKLEPHLILQGCYPVFNAAQIDGIPELEVHEISQSKALDIADCFIRSSRCPINESLASEGAFYSPTKDTITLPDRAVFVTPEDFAATLFHEQGHSTGHKNGPVPRELTGAFGSTKYAIEELRVELATVFMEADLGFTEFGIVRENHAAYLQSWAKSAGNDDRKALASVLSAADKIANSLQERAAPELSQLAPETEQSISSLAKNADTLTAEQKNAPSQPTPETKRQER